MILNRLKCLCILALFFAQMIAAPVFADDGYKLWLKYDPIKDTKLKSEYAVQLSFIALTADHPTIAIAVRELQTGLNGMLGKSVAEVKKAVSGSKGIIFRINASEAGISEEGFKLQTENGNTVITARTEKGVLYGVFELLRKVQTGQSIKNLSVVTSPKINLRLLNHWDNNNGTIERGYAGMSLWKWYELPERIDPRYIEYARANASIGINGTMVNNVNASARFLTEEYLGKVKAMADVFRPYGIKVYLSVNFASPRLIGKLKTADPLDEDVRKFWKDKAKEIYALIPDFGGFLVKANSEGEPGPMDYKRTHVDGANMLAEAVKPYNGIVMWRSFVYAADPNGDRFKAAYNEFKPFDGQFADNVIIQVKNGPIDFMPREPISPLFGAMKKTPVSMEFQLTQEYLGWATHWVFEAPLFKECLETDTYAGGEGSTVAKVIDGSVYKNKLTSMVGVANTGSDRNWTGHPMAQANWYSLGRLAWDHNLSSEQIADEWVKMSLTRNPQSVEIVKNIMLRSREIYVDYTSPLGLHHLMGEGHHFGPEPWLVKAPRPDWTAIYYHKADSTGIGFNRTATGSDALGQYEPGLRNKYADPDKCPMPYLMWFHHVSWDKALPTGRNVWEEIVHKYYTGADEVLWMQKEWKKAEKDIDGEIYDNVAARLKTQYKEALWWRDSAVLYFKQQSKKEIPAQYPKPQRTIEEVKKIVDVYHVR
ncbi:alpha-glucuronidase family glycosyl hydrolase [Emticicia sp. CRIBPO]|uniref:alpha-glucuronidase family glycosyl hydrolase n=1 Tax=Emticicia sp. CRIBPO TaxID=2683258 RepID=UPI0038D4B512